jgi:hypothetical protein
MSRRNLRTVAWPLLAASLFAVASCATIPRAPDENGRPWLLLDTSHVSVQTDLDAADARAVLAEIERWRVALPAALSPLARVPLQRLSVIALANHELQTMSPVLNAFFVDGPYVGSVIALGNAAAEGRERIVKHEIAHAVVNESFRGAPQWLNEGLAVYLEGVELDERMGEVTWGRVAPGPSSAVPLGAAVLARVLDPAPWPKQDVGELERAAGRLVFALAHRRPRELACLLERSAGGGSVDGCFDAAHAWADERVPLDFGGSAPALGHAHVDVHHEEARLAPSPAADVHAALALLAAGVEWTLPGDSEYRGALSGVHERHLRQALALDPTQVLAASLALAPVAPGGDPRGDVTARLVAAHPEDWRVWHWRAAVLSTGRADARLALERAAALAPHRADVLEVLLHDAILAREWKLAGRFAIKAWHLSPRSSARAIVVAAMVAQGRLPPWLDAVSETSDEMASEVGNFLAAVSGKLASPRVGARPVEVR